MWHTNVYMVDSNEKYTQHVPAYNKKKKVLSIVFSVLYYVRQRNLSRHNNMTHFYGIFCLI